MSKLFIQAAGALLIAGASTTAWAGGHGGHGAPMMHPGGFNGGHWGGGGFHAMPPVAGTIHVRANGGNYFSGYGHTNTALGGRPVPGFYGHANTAFGGRPGAGYGWHVQPGYGHGPSLYGHTTTAFAGRPGYGWHDRGGYRVARLVALPNGGRPGFNRREPIERRFDRADRFAFDHRTLRYGRYARNLRYRYGVVAGGAYGGGYGGYGVDLSAAPSYGGYAEAPLASSYSEAPLNQVFGTGGGYPYGGEAPSANYAPSSGSAGGPQVIVINNNYAGSSQHGAWCGCSRDQRPSPVVYRFGVGSYY